MDRLQKLRDELAVPLLINDWHKGGSLKYRGYRTCYQNSKVKGATRSFHLQGRAFDVTPKDNDLDRLVTIAKKYFNGIIVYKTFVHLDTRFGEPYFEDKR